MKKTHTFIFGIAIAGFLGLQSCKTPELVEGDNLETDVAAPVSESIEFTTLKNGVMYGYGAEGIEDGGIVINSEAEWNELTTQMNSVNQAIDIGSIDFDKNTVLAYFDKIRTSGGHSVEISDVSKKPSVIVARIKTAAPSGAATDIMTQPFCIVSIPKTTDTITFIE